MMVKINVVKLILVDIGSVLVISLFIVKFLYLKEGLKLFCNILVKYVRYCFDIGLFKLYFVLMLVIILGGNVCLFENGLFGVKCMRKKDIVININKVGIVLNIFFVMNLSINLFF